MAGSQALKHTEGLQELSRSMQRKNFYVSKRIINMAEELYDALTGSQ